MNYVIANELHLKGKARAKLETVKSVFGRAGKECEVLLTTHAGHAREYAEEISSSEGEHSVIAMGGDGTLHEILNGIKDFGRISMGIIPHGTGNDFAEAAGIPSNIKEAAEIVAFRAPSHIDYIELSTGLRSLNAVGMGLDVEVLKKTYAGKGKGRSKYLRALLSTVFGFKGFSFAAEYEGKSEKRYGLIAAVGNGKQIGGGIKLFPDASIDDGLIDLIIVDYISRPRLFASLLKLMCGKVNSIPEATVKKVTSVKLINPAKGFSIQAEGELYDDMQIEAHVVPGGLKFYI